MLDSDSAPLDVFIGCTEETSRMLCQRVVFGDRLVMGMLVIPGLKSRANSMQCRSDDATKNHDIPKLLEDARRADAILARGWNTDVPAAFRYISRPLCYRDERGMSRPEGLYPRSLDTYHDPFVANTWNKWRSSRIQVLQVIMQCISFSGQSKGMPDPPAEYAAAATSALQLVDDICSSIPYHLGYLDTSINESFIYPHAADEVVTSVWRARRGRPERTAPQMLLVQPLLIASNVDGVPASQRRWMRKYLAEIMQEWRPN